MPLREAQCFMPHNASENTRRVGTDLIISRAILGPLTVRSSLSSSCFKSLASSRSIPSCTDVVGRETNNKSISTSEKNILIMGVAARGMELRLVTSGRFFSVSNNSVKKCSFVTDLGPTTTTSISAAFWLMPRR
eukprot:Lithocolla_globosa_v1_NODE_675_length_3461_cov_9.961538.p3 type:complete len:134 gc:universal NODE_675_length_3461_cov_9.961538:2984-3385(+)